MTHRYIRLKQQNDNERNMMEKLFYYYVLYSLYQTYTEKCETRPLLYACTKKALEMEKN